MKFEYKIVIMGILFSCLCILLFTYGTTLGQKTMYVYQVGIYKEEKNKEDKLDELSKQGIKGYCYQKENQYYVLSMISENRQEIDTHASQVKGILKTYKVSKDTTLDILLQNLAKGVTHD